MFNPHRIRFALVLVCWSLVAATSGQVSEKSLIIPGKSVGELKLGDSEEQFRSIFKWKPNADEHYTYPAVSGCPASEELHWLDAGNPPFASRAAVHAGVFAYLRNGHIFQISVATPLFRTTNGITEDSPPENVRRFYSKLESYWRVNQRDPATGDRDFIYWVDKNQGIAFEFAYAGDVRKRLVYRTYVFQPGTDFLPEGWFNLLSHG